MYVAKYKYRKTEKEVVFRKIAGLTPLHCKIFKFP